MKFIINTMDDSGVAFGNATDFVTELLTMAKAAIDSGGTVFAVGVHTDAGTFRLNRNVEETNTNEESFLNKELNLPEEKEDEGDA